MERKTGLKRRGNCQDQHEGGHSPSQRVNERILSAQNILGGCQHYCAHLKLSASEIAIISQRPTVIFFITFSPAAVALLLFLIKIFSFSLRFHNQDILQAVSDRCIFWSIYYSLHYLRFQVFKPKREPEEEPHLEHKISKPPPPPPSQIVLCKIKLIGSI